MEAVTRDLFYVHDVVASVTSPLQMLDNYTILPTLAGHSADKLLHQTETCRLEQYKVVAYNSFQCIS
jgi:hypothetical protein